MSGADDSSSGQAITPRVGSPRPVVAIVGTGLTPYRVHLLRRLAREVPDVEFVTLNTIHPSIEPWNMAVPDGVRFEHLDTRARRSRGLGERLAQWRVGGKTIARLRALRPGAVVVNGYHHPGHLRVLRWLRGEQIPALFASDSNVHADFASGITRVFKAKLVRSVVAQCDPILVCGRLGQQYFERYGARPDQCIYVPYEPDYALIDHLSPAVVEQVRERFRFSPQRKRLVFCGRLAEQKRPDLALDAFTEAASEFPEWDLVFVGDGPLREWLGYVTPSDLRHRVQFTGFVGKQDQISAIYRCCHAMILSSDWEPWGVVINEAVAAGLAVVATNVVGAAVELVQQGRNGLLVPPGSQRELAVALREVMQPGRVEQMRAEAPGALADWRAKGDPVTGMRRALERVGVLGAAAGAPIARRRRGARRASDGEVGHRPKVVFVGGGLTPYRIHYMRRLAAEVPQMDVMTVTTRHPFFEPWKTVEVPGFRVKHLDPNPPPKPWRGAEALNQREIGRRLAHLLEAEGPDAVVFHSYDHLAHLRGLEWCRRRHIPAYLYVDSNIHGDQPGRWRGAVKQALIPWVARRVHKVLVFGSLGRAYYKRYGVPPEQCVFCPMEPDYRLIESVTPQMKHAAMERFGLHPARKRFMFVGRITGVKGPDVLIEAFAKMAADAPDWDLLMVGDGDMRAACEAAVPEPLRARIRWTGFVNDQPTLVGLFHACHAMVLPSLYEPWALVVSEGAAAGMPLITTNVVGASAELVRDGVNGRAVPVRDVEALARAMREVAQPGAADRMGAESKRILAQWRRDADPVDQLLTALREAGLAL